MQDIVIFVLEIIGTVSFAVSGAFTGLQKKMDIFGVVILGLVTSVGGGVMRDIILGQTPPATFSNPVYALVAIFVSVVVFFPAVRKFMLKKQHLYDLILLVMDSIGLGVFTVVGIQIASISSKNIFLLIFVGVITGIGGGVLRDVLAGNTPYIFIKHFYASASLIGAICCVLLLKVTDEIIAMLCSAFVIIILRLLAAHFRWSLPKGEI